ncbi:MAG: ABC transporter substrate-binding protein [Candidatus Atribacteria bacterium]|nr:ABC transporter substrate-binding protein [Candidatus Atribacteria bacterium]
MLFGKRITKLITITVLTLLVVVSSAGAATFKLGGLANLKSGYGQSMVSGTALAIKEINAAGGVDGVTFSIDWQDTESSAATGRMAVQKLIFDTKIDALIGCHGSTVVLAVEGLIAENEIVEMAMGSASQVTQLGNPWLFRVREDDALTAKVLANFTVNELGLTKIAIFHMSEQYGVGGKDNTVAALAEYGVEPVAIEAHNQGDVDFSSQLLNIRQSGAEAMILYSGIPDIGILIKQARQLIPGIEILSSSVGATAPAMDVAGEAGNGVYAVVSYSEDNPDEKVQKFVQAHVEEFGVKPYDFFDPLAYDAVYLLAEAIKIAGSTDHAAVRDALHEIQGYKGATGLEYYVQPNGETINELLLIQIQDGKHQVVDTIKG